MKQPLSHRAAMLSLGLLALILSGCANHSTTVHSYVDPNVSSMNLHGVLVVAVAQKMPARVEFENAYVKALRIHSVDAVASHTLLPSDKPSKEDVIAAATKANLDTILVTRFMGKSAEEVYHPGTIYYDVAPVYSPYGYGFGGYYGHAYEVAYQQPVWTSNVAYTLSSNLFATESKEHLWQMVSDTIKAGGTKTLRDDVIKSFVDNMKEVGLFK